MSLSTDKKLVLIEGMKFGTNITTYEDLLSVVEGNLYRLGSNVAGDLQNGIAILEQLRDVTIPATIKQLKEDWNAHDGEQPTTDY